MKKSFKPAIFSFLFYLVTVTLFVLGYVGIKINCEELVKQKILAEEELENKKNLNLSLNAKHQYLISEERITSIAENELDMIKRNQSPAVLTVDKNKIETNSKIIEEKYE